LALNVAELRRFINQQDEVILYYERAVSVTDLNNEQEEDPQKAE